MSAKKNEIRIFQTRRISNALPVLLFVFIYLVQNVTKFIESLNFSLPQYINRIFKARNFLCQFYQFLNSLLFEFKLLIRSAYLNFVICQNRACHSDGYFFLKGGTLMNADNRVLIEICSGDN